MRKALLSDVQPGERLARTLFYPYGGAMLKAGAQLTGAHIQRLRELGYTYVYLYDEDLDDVLSYDLLDEPVKQAVTVKVRTIFEDIRTETRLLLKTEGAQAFSEKDVQQKLDSLEFQNLLKGTSVNLNFYHEVNRIVDQLLSEDQLCLSVAALKNATGYVYDHSLSVTLYTLLLARRLGFQKNEWHALGQGAILHDIGYSILPENILFKKKALTDHDQSLLAQHTTYGFLILKSHPEVSLLAAHVAYQHHERQDGKGYPRGLKGTNRIVSAAEEIQGQKKVIHRFANIVAVADYYDLWVTDRPYAKAVPPDEAMLRVRQARGSLLNEEVVDAFLSFMPIYPVGTPVLITDGVLKGYRGVVVATPPAQLDKPRLRILYRGKDRLDKPFEVDLRKESHPIRAIL